MRFRSAHALGPAVALILACGVLAGDELSQRVDPWVLETAARGQTEFLVMLREQADLRGAHTLPNKEQKGAFVFDALSSTAARTQGPLLALLESRGAPHRAFWVANVIWVLGDKGLVEELAARDDVFHIYANPTVHLDEPAMRPLSQTTDSPDTIEWNILKVHAPDVWNLGFTGQGIVVSGGDTGYQWDHPALKAKYRGWNGQFANHNYNWHDAIHSGGGTCGADAQAPCDDFGHGTHTMGTMVGDDGGSNQIGMAPGARWIGCRNMDQGNGTPDRYTECFQVFIAPTNLQNQNPDPSKAPHVVNNSWGCPPSEGCNDPTVLQTIVENTRAAGIEVVVSAGNSGSGCSSVDTPAAIYDASFSVGATDSGDNIAGFSSRGPVTIDGSGRLKPDVSAPGVSVRSSVPTNSYAVFDGTSMAGPHVAGLVALLLSATPSLSRDPDAIEPVVTGSAVPRTSSQTCGGVPGSQIPNNTYGWGRVDALAAVTTTSADLSVTQADSPDPSVPGLPIVYDVTVGNAGPATADSVSFTDTLSITVSVDSATPSQGSCTLQTHAVTCDLGSIPSGGQATIHISITPSVAGTVTSAASVSGGEADPVASNNSWSEQTTVIECPPPAPLVTAPVSTPPQTDGQTASVPLHSGHTTTWAISGGTITGGQGTSQLTFQSGDPGTTMTLQAVDTVGSCSSAAGSALVSVDFLDVPPAHPFHDFVNTVSRNGVTAGCGGGNYCPGDPVTRAQMAVFLLKASLGSSYAPPACSGIFGDVPCPSPFADWIEDLSSRGVTAGCGGGNYCPDNLVTRAQMAVFLLKMLLGAAYAPPPCSGIFGDVPCPSLFSDWIEDLSGRGITAGCGGGNYCPDNPNTRGQMAVFMVRTFSLQ